MAHFSQHQAYNQQGNYDMTEQQYMSNQSNSQNISNNQASQIQVVQTSSNNSGKYKTSVCRHFKNGNCQLGNSCHFAHGEDEVRTSGDPLPQNIPQQPKVVSNNFKTQNCRYYEKGFCKNQNACCFAHGDQDLQFSQSGNMQMSQNVKITDSILLISILQNLEHVFPNDQQILSKLQYAQQIARNNDQKGAFHIISEIMKDPKRTEDEKALYNTIYTNAQMFHSQQQQMYNQTYIQPILQQMANFQNQIDPSSYYMQQQMGNQQQTFKNS